uniref:Uncharacterized protein n=1 Tax=Oryza punctata TaxID=4537 RepID=A0A0E0L3H0_ORYPU
MTAAVPDLRAAASWLPADQSSDQLLLQRACHRRQRRGLRRTPAAATACSGGNDEGSGGHLRWQRHAPAATARSGGNGVSARLVLLVSTPNLDPEDSMDEFGHVNGVNGLCKFGNA